MLSAYYLRQYGLEVQLIERGGIGRESSWAGGGIISPLYPWRYPSAVTKLAAWGQKQYPLLTKNIKDNTGIDPEYIVSGFLLLEVEDVIAARNWAGKWGVRLTETDQAEIQKLEPKLKKSYHTALWMPKVAQVRNPRLLLALKTWLLQNEVEIIEQTEVLGLKVKNNKITSLKSKDGEIKVERVLVAGGAWTSKILDKYKANVNVSPVRGQMIMYKTPPGFLNRITIMDQHYLIPRKDGRVLFGSTLEQAGFDKSTSSKVRDKLNQLATTMVPELSTMPIERHWAGLRPGSPKGIPYIGRHPEIKNMFINAGHFRNGVVLGPASAKLIAQIITGNDLIMDKTPYSIKPKL